MSAKKPVAKKPTTVNKTAPKKCAPKKPAVKTQAKKSTVTTFGIFDKKTGRVMDAELRVKKR